MTFMPTPQQHELDAVVIKRFTQDFPFDFYWKDNQTNNYLINMGCVPLLTQVLTACENRRQQFPVKDFGAHFIGRFVQSSETFSNIHNAHGLNDEVGPVVEKFRAALFDNWKNVSDYKTELLPLVVDLRDAMNRQGQKALKTGCTYYPNVPASASTSVFALHALQRPQGGTPLRQQGGAAPSNSTGANRFAVNTGSPPPDVTNNPALSSHYQTLVDLSVKLSNLYDRAKVAGFRATELSSDLWTRLQKVRRIHYNSYVF